MLDLRQIREQPDALERALAARGPGLSLRPILAADQRRRQLVTETEELKAERNRASEAIGQAKRRGEKPEAEMARVREVGERIRELDAKLREADAELDGLLLELPNVPHPSVPVGVSADDNVEIRRWGEPRTLAFEPRQHFELGEALGVMDFERAAKIAKSRFVVLWGPGARLSRALAQLMLDLHTREHGFTEVWVPHLVNAQTVSGVGVLRKFEDQLFRTQVDEGDRPLYLIPTAEVALTALHGGEVLPEAELPRRYCALTPSYRREAGAAGQDTRGMIRQHQFDKVEMVKVTTPAQSYDELELMVKNAEAVLQRLELPYRVMVLSSGDMGFQSAKTYDLEAWLPGQGKYREISSCSNCEAFQARRLDMKFRPAGGGRPDFCHTLNGSGLAVGRTLIAVLENYQEADGSVRIPAALRPYMDGLERIGPGGRA
ncbi:MAG TPA: serine--tRNA ligase [Candidatus Limnocylindrales bacterium]|nr:serine--tRNA ligase [Candidatus Limnocylindrales bacterium]